MATVEEKAMCVLGFFETKGSVVTELNMEKIDLQVMLSDVG
jgi:hypothetical protein